MKAYDHEPDDDVVPLTEEGLHEAAGEVSAWVFGFLVVFSVCGCCLSCCEKCKTIPGRV
jgi:hypothetical protein